MRAIYVKDPVGTLPPYLCVPKIRFCNIGGLDSAILVVKSTENWVWRATWRAGYNEHEKSRLSAGITNGRVFRSAEDPNDVVILQNVADVAKARTWLGSNDLKASMQKSGVIGSPTIRFAVAA